MTDTTFAIELKGLNLPDEVQSTLQGQLRSVVLAEIAKTDLGKELSVQSLPNGAERTLPQTNTILGIVVRHLAERNARNVDLTAAGADGALTLYTPRYTAAELAAMLNPAPHAPMAGRTAAAALLDAPLLDVIESVYYRPDVRDAVASQSRALAELLGRDPQAVDVLNEITGGMPKPDAQSERLGPLAGVAILVATSMAAGAAAGYLINRHQ